jgi:hypothetical protein
LDHWATKPLKDAVIGCAFSGRSGFGEAGGMTVSKVVANLSVISPIWESSRTKGGTKSR